ncbi:MAG TPA: right-handed parallel beta-helix repeat-containing protein [Solirubrobacteraceae bacterium]|nr:right-handed parallel beta-helix repeat-containing protein [Solirubrobacteraceae bacterium]
MLTTPMLLGDEAVEAQHDYLSAGQAEAFRFQALASGDSATLHLYLDAHSRARTVVVGIYANASGHPGALLSTGSTTSPQAGAWNTVAISRSTLAAGATYWLAILGDGGTLRFRDRGNGPCPSEGSAQTNLGALPASWSTGPLYNDCPVSAYVSGTSSFPIEPPKEEPPKKEPSKKEPAKEEPPKKEPPKEEPPKKELPKEEPPKEETTPPGGGTGTGGTGGSGTGTSGTTPPPSPACTQTVSSVASAASAVSSAAAGSAICLTAGSYGHLTVSGSHSGNVTVEPVPGASVSLEGATVASSSSYITIHDFDIGGGVNLGYGDSHITVDHNNINGQAPGGTGEGVEDLTVNCSAPNAPYYSGCTSTAPDTYLTIDGNQIHGYGMGGTEDAIHLNNWEHVTITANDIYNLEEHGNHTDAMQSVFGGHYMTFERNYEHDNQSQGFFIKDGDASEVAVNDNLFVRNNNEPSLYPGGEYNIQVFNTTGLAITNNTVWDGQNDIIRAEGAAEALTANVNHNVEQGFDVLHEGGPAYTLTEDYDIFAEAPWTFKMGSHSKVQSSPDFVDPAGEDYELASNPDDIGVNWQPSEYVYGPTGD